MCRWRVPRDAILTPAQWADAKKIFLDLLPQFFPQASQIIPSFVPLENDVRIRMDDMLQEEKGHNPAAAAIAPAAAAAVPAPAAAAPALVTPAAGAANAPVLDMDGDQKEEQVEEAEKRKILHGRLMHGFLLNTELGFLTGMLRIRSQEHNGANCKAHFLASPCSLAVFSVFSHLLLLLNEYGVSSDTLLIRPHQLSIPHWLLRSCF